MKTFFAAQQVEACCATLQGAGERLLAAVKTAAEGESETEVTVRELVSGVRSFCVLARPACPSTAPSKEQQALLALSGQLLTEIACPALAEEIDIGGLRVLLSTAATHPSPVVKQSVALALFDPVKRSVDTLTRTDALHILRCLPAYASALQRHSEEAVKSCGELVELLGEEVLLALDPVS